MKKSFNKASLAAVQRGILALGLFPVLASASVAMQSPDSVTEPYVRYTRALEAGDSQGAADAAQQAWQAGLDASIDAETQKALGTNAFRAFRGVDDWPSLIALAAPLAAMHDTLDELPAAMAILEQGILSGLVTLNRVHYPELMMTGYDLMWSHEAGIDEHMPNLLRHGPPQSREVLDRVDADIAQAQISELAGRGPEAALSYVNLQAALADVYKLAGDTDLALETLETAHAQLRSWQVADSALYDALYSSVSGLLFVMDAEDVSSGVSHFSDGFARGWCAYMRRNPSMVASNEFSLYPTRAAERGHPGALVRMQLRIPAAGGTAEIVEEGVIGTGDSLFLRSVRNQLQQHSFRPQCDADEAEVSVWRYEGFAIVSQEQFRDRAIIQAQVWAGYAPVEEAGQD